MKRFIQRYLLTPATFFIVVIGACFLFLGITDGATHGTVTSINGNAVMVDMDWQQPVCADNPLQGIEVGDRVRVENRSGRSTDYFIDRELPK